MALTPGEQAMVDRGVPVTSTMIPAAARERINAAIAAQSGGSAPALNPNEPAGLNPNEPAGSIQVITKSPVAGGLGSYFNDAPQQTALTAEQVRQAYLDLLDRTPSAQGLEYWTGIDLDPNIDYQDDPTSITTVEGLRKAIMEGPEYQARQAGDTTTKQIQEAYRSQLGRDPTIADYEYWTGLDFDPNITPEVTTELKDIEQIRQAISESPEFQERVEQGLEEPFQPTQPGQQGGQMVPFTYTDFPGGIYGPGQAMPNIFQPAGMGAPGTMIPAMAPGSQGDTGTAAPGPRTMVSPGITTYAYPQPFGNIDIFNRPGAQSPTPFNQQPAGVGAVPPQSPTNTTTQQDMTGGTSGLAQTLENLSPAQRSLLGNIFG